MGLPVPFHCDTLPPMTKHAENMDKVLTYEVGYLISPNLSEDKAKDVVAHIASSITKHEGEVVSEGALTTKQLAYEIITAGVGKKNRFKTAYFGFTLFKAFSEEVPAIKKAIEKDSHIVRLILIRKDRETVLMPVEEAIVEGAPTESGVAPVADVSEVVAEEKIDEVEIDKKIDSLVIS